MSLIRPRETIAAMVHQHGETYAGLSRFIGKPDDYLSRYVRGRAGELSRDDANLLGRYLGIDPRRLGGDPPPPPKPAPRRWRPHRLPPDTYAEINVARDRVR